MLPLPCEFEYDVWTYLAKTKKPVVMYGMGNGAEKILMQFERRGISVADFFASDGFVRGHSFHGKKVLSYSDIVQKYDDFIIVLSFASSLPDVISRFFALAEKHEFYAPDVPVFGGELFTLDFYKANFNSIKSVYDALADERSRQIYESVIRYKISGEIKYLSLTDKKRNVLSDVLSPDKYEICVDVGAYVGDTAREFIESFPAIKKIYCIEPDKKNFKKLAAYAAEETRCEILPLNIAAASIRGEAEISVCGNRNSSLTAGAGNSRDFIATDALDNRIDDDVDYIKYDVEGLEADALCGTDRIICRCKPDMLVSLYHKSEDMFSLPVYLMKKYPFYKLFLRRFDYIPAWDLNLYAIFERGF